MSEVGKTVTEFFVIQWDKCVGCDGAGLLFSEDGRTCNCPQCSGTGGLKKEVPLATALRAIVFKDLVGGKK